MPVRIGEHPLNGSRDVCRECTADAGSPRRLELMLEHCIAPLHLKCDFEGTAGASGHSSSYMRKNDLFCSLFTQFPMCNGAHNKHNEATGWVDSALPCVISFCTSACRMLEQAACVTSPDNLIDCCFAQRQRWSVDHLQAQGVIGVDSDFSRAFL